jgi:HEAT repeat protein
MNDPDVQTRRAVALFLLGTPVNSWSDSEDFDNYRAALTRVITDPDTRVRELAAQAAGNLGPRGARVVPALISLLKYEDVGSRNTACIGLAGIGPAARDALPALRQALSDQHPEVRFFAQRAVDKIDVK